MFLFRRSALWLGCAILTGGFVAAEEFAGGPARSLAAWSAYLDANEAEAPAANGAPAVPDADAESGWIIDAEDIFGEAPHPNTRPARSDSEGGSRKPVPRKVHRTQRVTAYCDVGQTAAGVRSGVGQCAAPVDIPFGSKVYVPALRRTFIVTDRTDTRFSHNTVDIFIPSRAQCEQFGRRFLKCEITLAGSSPAYGKLRVPAAKP